MATIFRLEDAHSVQDVDGYFESKNIRPIGKRIAALQEILASYGIEEAGLLTEKACRRNVPARHLNLVQPKPHEVYAKLADRLARDNIIRDYTGDPADLEILLMEMPEPVPGGPRSYMRKRSA